MTTFANIIWVFASIWATLIVCYRQPSINSYSFNRFGGWNRLRRTPLLSHGSQMEITVDGSPRLNVGIIGGGLSGLITAMELADRGHRVQVFESRNFFGGKAGSYVDDKGNHIEMGLHVFFGCYYKLFEVMKRIGALENVVAKEHTHIFVNKDAHLGELDFRHFKDAPFSGIAGIIASNQLSLADKFATILALSTSPVLKALINEESAMKDIRALDDISFSQWFLANGGTRHAIERLWDPIAYALGFLNCDDTSARCMLTVFQLFATRSDASRLHMLRGSPDVYLHNPLIKYLQNRGVKLRKSAIIKHLRFENDTFEGVNKPCKVSGFQYYSSTGKRYIEASFDAVVIAADVPGVQKLLPESFRQFPDFDAIYHLKTVPVQTVQLRFDGWVTETKDANRQRNVEINYMERGEKAPGIDNLLYSADADFSCFADLAVTSPNDYYRPGEGSLLQCVLTPGDRWVGKSSEEISNATLDQVHKLFPSSKDLKCIWSNVVNLRESLYREAPGMDKYRPSQATSIRNLFLAGSYTFQDYIDSMEGATRSALACAQVLHHSAHSIANMAKSSKVQDEDSSNSHECSEHIDNNPLECIPSDDLL